MRPSLLRTTLMSCFAMCRPVMIEGSTGLGKTQLAQSAAIEVFGSPDNVIQFPTPTMNPEDWAMPAPNAERTLLKFLINDRFPVEGTDTPDEGALILDEAASAENAIQKAIANLIQEREVYGRKLKKGWSIVLTGNRVSDRAGANRVLSHLRHRFTTIEFEPTLDDWTNWALGAGVRPEVIGLMRFKPGLLNAPDPQLDIYPTPRGWAEGVSPIIGNVPYEAEFEMFKGAVGEGAAAEMVGFLQLYRKLPNPDAILMSPDTYEVPTEANVCYALAGAMAHRATVDNFDAIVTYVTRMKTEFGVLAILDATHKCPAVQNTRAYMKWAAGFGAKVLL